LKETVTNSKLKVYLWLSNHGSFISSK
jgi:hypothetical protein